MNKNFFTRNLIFFVFLVPFISVIVSIIMNTSAMILVGNIMTALFIGKITLNAYTRRVIYKINAKMAFLILPMFIIAFTPSLMIYFSTEYNPEFHNSRMINSLLVIPTLFSILLSLPCLVAIKTAYKGLETQAENIMIMTGEKYDYVTVNLNDNGFLVKDEFIFGTKDTSYKGTVLSIFAIYSYLKETNKKLKDLNNDDIEVISMMSI